MHVYCLLFIVKRIPISCHKTRMRFLGSTERKKERNNHLTVIILKL